MALVVAQETLQREYDLLSTHVRNFAGSKPPLDSSVHFSFLDECLLEGILSRIWQTWCAFCRRCVIESCLGTVNSGGVLIGPLPGATTEEHVSDAAIQAAKKKSQPTYWGGSNGILRLEPNWGDVDVLARIVGRLVPTNANQMLAAFSSGSHSAKALQLLRNGAAHNHAQNLTEIQSLRSAYVAFPIGHPTHAMFWTEPSSKDFLITQALDVLKAVGLAAIA